MEVGGVWRRGPDACKRIFLPLAERCGDLWGVGVLRSSEPDSALRREG